MMYIRRLRLEKDLTDSGMKIDLRETVSINNCEYAGYTYVITRDDGTRMNRNDFYTLLSIADANNFLVLPEKTHIAEESMIHFVPNEGFKIIISKLIPLNQVLLDHDWFLQEHYDFIKNVRLWSLTAEKFQKTSENKQQYSETGLTMKLADEYWQTLIDFEQEYKLTQLWEDADFVRNIEEQKDLIRQMIGKERKKGI